MKVTIETSIEKAIERWSVDLPDVMVIDIDAENQNLIAVCKSFRKVSMVPILLLLPAHHETLILDAYTAGVDDVVVRPISPIIFQAKIMAWARRSWTTPQIGLGLIKSEIYRLDPTHHYLTVNNGQEIQLTNLEFRLLNLLMSRPGHIFSSNEISKFVWGEYGSGDPILLKNVVYRLRKKIETDPGNPVYLRTEIGGYSFQN